MKPAAAPPKVLRDLRVLRWAHGGDAVAIPESGPMAGRIVFLEGAVPGDVLVAEITESRERFARARILEVSEPSPERVPTSCSIQARCGGCPWMLGSAAVQAESRRAIIEGEVKKVLGADAVARIELAPPITPDAHGPAHPATGAYRQRLRLAFAVTPGRDRPQVRLGFFARRAHTLIDVERCAIAHPRINKLLPELRETLAARHPEGASGRATLLAGDAGVACLVEPERGAPYPLGLERVTLRFGRFEQTLHPRSFTQANADVTGDILEALETWARGVASDRPAPHTVELFAGSGTLTMALLAAGHKVTAYEVDDRARGAFDETVSAHDGEATFHALDLSLGLLQPPPSAPPDAVLLDPPRTGAREMMPWVRASPARHVAYLSCDLATGLRDCAMLIGDQGPFRVERIIGYDMFPHSGHQEILVLLSRR